MKHAFSVSTNRPTGFLSRLYCRRAHGFGKKMEMRDHIYERTFVSTRDTHAGAFFSSVDWKLWH